MYFSLHLGVRLMLSGTVTPNHGYLLLKNIGEGSKALLCITNNTACCSRAQVPGGGILGDWYYPNGTLVPNLLINNQSLQWDFYRNRGPSVVRMHRRRGGVTGIYRCEVPDANGVYQRMYVGLYTGNTGE